MFTKKNTFQFSIVLLMLVSNPALTQSTILQENFDSCEGAYSEFGSFSDGSSDYFIRSNGSTETVSCVASATSGEVAFLSADGFYYTGEDVDRPTENPNTTGEFGSQALSSGVYFSSIDVSSYTNVQVKLDVAASHDIEGGNTFETGDYLKVYVDPTGASSWQLIGAFEANTTVTSEGAPYRPLALDTDLDGEGDGVEITETFTTFTFDVPAGATTMKLRVEMNSTNGNQEMAFDNVIVQGTSASSLSAGDIVFTGYNARGTDDFAFMATTDIPAGTEIRFTDRGWTTGGAFRTGDGAEGEILYTVGSGGLAVGEQVVIAINAPSVISGTGTVSAVSSTMSFSTAGDQILAFIGTSGTPTTFLAGLQMNGGAWDADATANTTSSLPTGLVNGSTGFVISPEVSGAIYNCTVTSGSAADIKTAVFNQDNWTLDDSNHLTLPCSAPSAPSSATVAATVFLEGAYNGTDLNTTLNSNIPTSQPYSFNGHSGGSAASIPANAVDWVLVELREAGSAAAALDATKVGSAAGFLMNDGSIKATDGTSDLTVSLSGNSGADFYVVIYHRNHLPIMSASAISDSGGTYTIDFTSNSANTYETTNALTSLSGGKFGMAAGDTDGDGDIDATDLSTWRTNNGAVFSYGTNGVTDFNLDGVINAIDRNDFHQKNTSKTRKVPTT